VNVWTTASACDATDKGSVGQKDLFTLNKEHNACKLLHNSYFRE
jgi:hypothetical protein